MQYLDNKENINIDFSEKKSILQKELNTKEILIGLGVTGLVLAYGFLSVYPKYTQLQSAKNELEGINNNIALYEAKLNSMPQLEDKLDSLNRELKVKSRILSHNMEDGMFLIGLSKLMKGVSVDLVDYSMEDVIPYESFYAIPTNITVRGDYRSVREVMYYLEEQKNMTQILDYNMKTYMPEETSVASARSSVDTSSVETKLVADSKVYWTADGNAYHKQDCEVFAGDKLANDDKYEEGTAAESGKTGACQVCKPYTEQQVETQQTETAVQQQTQSSTQTQEKPKSKGQVEATFKFMMYSSNNPVIELENDNPSTWKPGKYNPFVTTSR